LIGFSFSKVANGALGLEETTPKSASNVAAQFSIKDDHQDHRLADLSFRFPLRKYQQEILALMNSKLDAGEKQIHIVAPPGAGKTIIGLQIVSQFKCPSLILSPNTTIQSQWGQKLDLFLPPGMESVLGADILGTHEDKPLKPLTLLTYQVLSTPGKEQEYLDKLAHQAWDNE
jgi:superfamily II DNA or RNA helicase